ncbi:MAG: metal ABC transporter permease [Candidatus Hydrogenedentota bacterium]|nr:MAG: metal ABC transporter permease [Candidatus Hydrogenedentota bacterium]
MLDALYYPFMQRALIAGIILAALLAWLGVFVIMKKMSFFSDGIAHASLGGIAIGILVSVHPLTTALVFSIMFSLIIYFLEKKTTLSSDAIIGMLFTSGMALGVVLISLRSGYQPDLVSFLFGNILAIRSFDLLIISLLSVVIIVFLIYNHKNITLMALDIDTAYLAGVRVNLLQITFYIILAVSVVLGLKILGIILVSALLVIPPSTAKLLSKSFKGLLVRSVCFSEGIVLLGIALSYYLDLPTGPMIVLVGTGIFLAVFCFGQLAFLDRG